MHETFQAVLSSLNRIGIYRIASDIYQVPDCRGFVKSPVTTDSTRSCKLYRETNSFFDFAGCRGGDAIKFVSYVRGTNNWESLQYLTEFYSLKKTDIEGCRAERRTALDKNADRRQEVAFRRALNAQIERLKHLEDIYSSVLENPKIEPFSDEWCLVKNELPMIRYKLDILCAADMNIYRKMRSSPGKGLSDYSTWVRDAKEVLKSLTGDWGNVLEG